MPGAYLGADVWINEYLTPQEVHQHGITAMLAQRRTPFQEMWVVESATWGKALVLDGKWQTCTGDEFLYHEPLIHVPCVCHGSPKRVLIAGGADGGALREALKWNTVEEVLVADIDGDVIDACRELLPEIHQGAFDDPRAKVVAADAFDLIAGKQQAWDVIIADLTDPIEEGPAYKLFTREFFEHCRRALRPGGYLVNQAGSVSPVLMDLTARVVKTIESVFPHVTVVTANVPTYGSQWGLALASEQAINTRPDPRQIDALLAERTTNRFRMFDGTTFLGALQTPKHVRDRLAAETHVHTLAEPPKFFGHGVAGP